MAIAITLSAASSCKDKVVDPKDKTGEKQTLPYNCPGCGLG